jgi:hypothetical protein
VPNSKKRAKLKMMGQEHKWQSRREEWLSLVKVADFEISVDFGLDKLKERMPFLR